MASNSKKRRRVLGASCILAALIIASSSFAWFTSKDEVTNRLTASSDYGVSIVESYEPPKNWVPGQTVNKDVYAVNTGNVAAFVKEDITGRLSYTYEKPVEYSAANVATLKTKGVELNDNQKKLIDGSTTMEAGSILAWTDTNEPTGAKSVARQQEGPAVASRWTPTETGVYVFRRSVDTTDANNTKFTYAGYYYDADTDKYYEIRIGNDVDPEHKGSDDEWQVSSGSLGAGVRVDKDGIVITENADGTNIDPLTGATYAAPTIQLVTVEEVAPKDVQFVFDEANKRLIVIEDTKGVAAATDSSAASGSNTYDASATAARAEVDYLNAKDDSDEATRDYNQVLFDYEYANALATARNKLVEAATTRRTAYNDYYKAQQNNTQAMSDVKDAAESLEDTYVTPDNKVANQSNPPTISPTELLGGSSSALYGTVTAATATTMPQVYQNYTDLTNKWDEMYGTNGLASKIATTLTDLQDTSKSAAEIAALVQDLIKYTTDLEQALSDYKDMYAELVDDSSLATHLDTGDVETKKASIESQKGNATSLKNAVTAADGVKAKSDDYTAKTAAEATQQTADSDAEAAWAKAVRDYNIAVTNAKNAYTTNIDGSVGHYNYVDHSSTLVPYNTTTPNNPGQVGGWSASSNTTDPTITYSEAAKQYNTYEEVTTDDDGTAATAAGFDSSYTPNKGTVGTIEAANMPDNATTGAFRGASAKTIKTLREEMNAAVNTTNTAKAAYDAATQKLVDESGIIIYVNLDPGYADNWTFDYDGFMSAANGQRTAEFYYNKILGAGETSTRLIDSVKLADEVKANAYKSFVFDLNVGLDSIQVSYDENDQNKISTTAVNADSAFKLDATMTDAKDITSNVIWAKP